MSYAGSEFISDNKHFIIAMPENTTGDIIHKFDDLISCRGKLLDYNFAEEYRNVITAYLKNQDTFETQFMEKTNECERLKMCLDSTQKKMTKFYSLYEDLIQHYNLLLENNDYANEFLEFSMHQKNLLVQFDDTTEKTEHLKITKDESNKDVAKVLYADDDDLIRRYELLLENNFAREFTSCHNHEEIRELHFNELTTECNRLKICLDAANKDITMLNSNLMKAHESLDAEKLQRKQVEIERDNLADLSEKLCCFLLKYEHLYSPSEINASQSEDNREEINFHVDNDPESLQVSASPSQYENDSKAAEEYDANELLSSNADEKHHIVVPDEASNRSCTEISNSTIALDQSHFECDYCGKSFTKKRDIISHVRVHMKNQSFRCEKCGESFATKNTLRCSNCDVRYNTRGHNKRTKSAIDRLGMNANGESATVVDNAPTHRDASNWCCDICGKYYSSKSSLNYHKRSVHLGKKPYKCTTCDKSFSRKDHLKRHKFVHGTEKRLKCPTCNRCFRTISAMRKHVRVVHQREIRFCCAHCDKRFFEKRNLLYHIHRNHFSVLPKKFKCIHCDKLFITKNELKLHQSVHTSHKPYKCSVCDKYFKDHNQRRVHERNIHIGGGSFVCEHCNKKYRYKGNLSVHLRKYHSK